MLALKLIIGSTRPNRAADLVAPWLVRRLEASPDLDLEVLDLRDWPLPLFQETAQTIGDVRDPTYSDPVVRRWNQTIKAADAFLVLTTEFNHSVPGQLKNALDSVFVSFGLRNKPVGFVGYSGSPVGAARAVEHLAQIVVEAEAVPLRNAVLVGQVQQAFGADGEPLHRGTDAALEVLLEDLAWWGGVLQRARAEGELPPGGLRLRSKLA